MKSYILDTNILSDLIDNPLGRTQRHLDRLSDVWVCTSIISAAELRYGAARRQSIRLSHEVDEVLSRIEIVAFSPDADHHYAFLRYQLERRGTPISGNDMLIAAHALALDATLVTANIREFARIEGLRLENWLD